MLQQRKIKRNHKPSISPVCLGFYVLFITVMLSVVMLSYSHLLNAVISAVRPDLLGFVTGYILFTPLLIPLYVYLWIGSIVICPPRHVRQSGKTDWRRGATKLLFWPKYYLKRLQESAVSDAGRYWNVFQSGKQVGQISDAKYACIQLELMYNKSMYLEQMRQAFKTILSFIGWLLVMFPVVAFWVLAIALYRTDIFPTGYLHLVHMVLQGNAALLSTLVVVTQANLFVFFIFFFWVGLFAWSITFFLWLGAAHRTVFCRMHDDMIKQECQLFGQGQIAVVRPRQSEDHIKSGVATPP